MMGYVVRSSGRHQIALAVLSAAVFGLSSVPLELQRRVVNDAIKNGATETIFWLARSRAEHRTERGDVSCQSRLESRIRKRLSKPR